MRKPRCRSPVTSITSVAANLPIASATNPLYQARRAASSCASRSLPAASAAARTFLYVSASAGLANLLPGAGTPPPGRYTRAELVQCSRNRSATDPMDQLMLGIRANPDSA